MRPLTTALLLLAAACPPGITRHFYVHTDDGAELKVLLEGNLDSGVILLLLHGGPVGSAHVYNSGSYAEELEARYAVAYLDQRGQGASQGRIDSREYTLQRAADDVDTVVDVLRGRYGEDVDIYLLGHSWGGMLGTLALLDTDASDDITGWAETAGCHDSLLEPRYVVSRMTEVGEAEVAAGREEARWGTILSFVQAFDPEATVFDDEDLYYLNQYGYEAESLLDVITWEDPIAADRFAGLRDPQRDGVAWWTASRELDVLYDEASTSGFTDRLGEIDVPGLYLYASYDFVCPAQLGRDAVAVNPHGESRYVELEHSGHSLMSNEPAAYVAAVEEFVEDTRGRR